MIVQRSGPFVNMRAKTGILNRTRTGIVAALSVSHLLSDTPGSRSFLQYSFLQYSLKEAA